MFEQEDDYNETDDRDNLYDADWWESEEQNPFGYATDNGDDLRLNNPDQFRDQYEDE